MGLMAVTPKVLGPRREVAAGFGGASDFGAAEPLDLVSLAGNPLFIFILERTRRFLVKIFEF